MKLFNINILLSSFISILFQLLNYKELSGKKIVISFKKFLLVFLIFWAIILNNAYNFEFLTAPVGLILLILLNMVVFKSNYNIVVNITTITYLIVIATEIILSILVIMLGIFDMEAFSEQTYLTLLFTFVTMFSSYLICKYVKIIKVITNKINNFTFRNLYKIFVILLFVSILLIIDFRYVGNFSLGTYIINIILFILIFALFIGYLYGEIKIDSEIHKIDILLDNISKYESIIDDNRINNHEMLNNLLLLKSFKNKNTKKYENLLDDMLVMYNKNNNGIKNISLLPKGIKGIVYYKLDESLQNELNIFINISKQISGLLEKIENDEYVILCKTIPILLDNAIESAKNSIDKKLLFDIYKENDSIIISIENSCDEKIDLDMIDQKYFSTRGKNRGLGLHIVNVLLSKSKKISLIKSFNNKIFASKLVIKK